MKKTAEFVHSNAEGLDKTYNLALAILLLDKLGDPNDEEIIQKLALHFIAGQTSTGGWSYVCPKLTKQQEQALLSRLQDLDPNHSTGAVQTAEEKERSREVLPSQQLSGTPAPYQPQPLQTETDASPGAKENVDPKSRPLHQKPPAKLPGTAPDGRLA